MNGNDFLALGLMSGTSRDGLDAAFVRTDGWAVQPEGPGLSLPYPSAFQDRLSAAVSRAAQPDAPAFADLALEIAARHAEAVAAAIARAGQTPDLIGFHGQTLLHAPDRGLTWQLGDAQHLANLTGLPVIGQFRLADVAAGGQGAPFAPLYHRARLQTVRPADALAVLNVGGVANLSWIGPADSDKQRPLIAFDTGPGNALLDDWVRAHGAGNCDQGGRLAAAGEVHPHLLDLMLDHPYFDSPPPKSLDRDDFSANPVRGLSLEDGAATLAALTVETVAEALRQCPTRPAALFVCGGGRHNPYLMQRLAERLGLPVAPVDTLGWRADLVEAEAFGYLAVRAQLGLPTSLPSVTGARQATVGGQRFDPAPPSAAAG